MAEELDKLLAELNSNPSPKAYSTVIDYYRRDGDHENALKYADKCLEEFPDDLKILLLKGKILMDTDDISAAKEIYEGILKGKPTHYMANQQFAKICRIEKNYETALKHLQILHDENPDDEIVEEEIKNVKTLLKEAPSDAEIYTVSNARLYESKGDKKKADEILRKILENDPGNKEAKAALTKLENPEETPSRAGEVEDKFADLFEEGETPDEIGGTEEAFEKDIFSEPEEKKEGSDAFGDIFGSEEKEAKKEESLDDIFGESAKEEVKDEFGDIFASGSETEKKEEPAGSIGDIFKESEGGEKSEEAKEDFDIFGSEEPAKETKKEDSLDDIFGSEEPAKEEKDEFGDIFGEGTEAKTEAYEKPKEEEDIFGEPAPKEEKEEDIFETEEKPKEEEVFEITAKEESAAEEPQKEEEKAPVEDIFAISESKEEETFDDTKPQPLLGGDEQVGESIDNIFSNIQDEAKEEEPESEETIIYSPGAIPKTAKEDTPQEEAVPGTPEEAVPETPEEAVPETPEEAVPGIPEEAVPVMPEEKEKGSDIEDILNAAPPAQEAEDTIVAPPPPEPEAEPVPVAEEPAPEPEPEEPVIIDEPVPPVVAGSIQETKPGAQVFAASAAPIPLYLVNKIEGKLDTIDAFLDKMLGFEGINRVLVVSEDGLLIAGKSKEENIDNNKFAALFAELMKKAGEVSDILGTGKPGASYIDLAGKGMHFIKDDYGYMIFEADEFIATQSLIPFMKYVSGKVKENGIL